ncbi:hypothetical protein CDD83_6077 [Cordyceps sp. RAO-2017]|nr:hypothetical protein CDD83_6077 [Cordyceps sp. RAO-2017]
MGGFLSSLTPFGIFAKSSANLGRIGAPCFPADRLPLAGWATCIQQCQSSPLESSSIEESAGLSTGHARRSTPTNKAPFISRQEL